MARGFVDSWEAGTLPPGEELVRITCRTGVPARAPRN
jgi:hypothetical protein